MIELQVDGAWHGPIRSFFGVHLVRVTARSEARTPALEEIREGVVSALNAQRRLDANEQAYQDLRERFGEYVGSFGNEGRRVIILRY